MKNRHYLGAFPVETLRFSNHRYVYHKDAKGILLVPRSVWHCCRSWVLPDIRLFLPNQRFMKVLRIWGTIWRRTLMPPVHKTSCRQIYCSFRSQSFDKGNKSFHLTAISTWQMIHVIAIVVILGACMIKYNLPLRGPWWHGNPKDLLLRWQCDRGCSMLPETTPRCATPGEQLLYQHLNSESCLIIILFKQYTPPWFHNHQGFGHCSGLECKTGDFMVVQEWSKERPFVSWFHRTFRGEIRKHTEYRDKLLEQDRQISCGSN